MEDFFKGIPLPKVTSEQGSQTVDGITEKEMSSAIARLKSNKAPGPDGFPSEWYKVMEGSLVPTSLPLTGVLRRTLNPPPGKRHFTYSKRGKGSN